jgi:translation initiation factor 2B subunit (eIF-2B alpha/beta/delta family)
MAAIAMTVAHVWWQAQSTASGDADAQLIAVRAAANAVARPWDSAVAGMTAWARTAVHGPVLTLSRSASVEGVLMALSRERASGDPLRVIVCESRPGGEGIVLAAALAGAGAIVTLIPDSAACVDDFGCGMLGADSVRADGSVVNKVGSRIVALVAQSAGKPVYVLAESLKVTAASYPLVIEDADLTATLPTPAPGVTTYSPLFERVPASLVTQIITEAGALTGDDVARLAAEAERAYTDLMRP